MFTLMICVPTIIPYMIDNYFHLSSFYINMYFEPTNPLTEEFNVFVELWTLTAQFLKDHSNVNYWLSASSHSSTLSTSLNLGTSSNTQLVATQRRAKFPLWIISSHHERQTGEEDILPCRLGRLFVVNLSQLLRDCGQYANVWSLPFLVAAQYTYKSRKGPLRHYA